MNDYTSPHRRNWSQASAVPSSNQAGSSASAKYTTAPSTTFNNYAVPNTAKWTMPQTNSGANTPTNPSTLTSTFPSFSGGIPPLYPSISAQSSGSIQGGVPSPFPISNTTPRHSDPSKTGNTGGIGGVSATTRSLDKTISASSSTNSLHNLTSGITKLQITTPYTPYNAGFTPYAVDIPTPSATTPNVGHSNGTTPTGFKFNNFSYSNVNIATPTTPLNATKMGYAMNPNALHHTAAMNNIYAMNAAMRQNSFSALTSTTPTANIKTMPSVITPTKTHIVAQPKVSANSTKLNSNAIPYLPTKKSSISPQQQQQQQQSQQSTAATQKDENIISYPSYAQAVNKEKDEKILENEVSAQNDVETTEKSDLQSSKETEDAIQKLNPLHWPSNPRHAKFYVIKSFGEDDVHKSIKYNLWCSTERGNRKLDEAFNESKRINAANIANDASMNGLAPNGKNKLKEIDSRDTKRGCPVYMFFSVNRSGCFCGMAQMISNYYKERHFGSWVQDGKWQGSFIVKWIYVKDIPNKDLKDIQLPNNDNRPVTFSRDTQEIPFNQGVEMLRRFIKYEPKTNILQDFKYYDDRERDIKQKRTQQIILQRMQPHAGTNEPQQQQQQQQQGQQQQQQRLIDNEKYASHQMSSHHSMNGHGGGYGSYSSMDNSSYGGGGGRYRSYNKSANQSTNGHFGGGSNGRRRYYSKNDRDNSSYRSYNNQHSGSSQHHYNKNNANSSSANYGSYQILKRNNHHNDDNVNVLNGDQNSDNSSPNRQRYSNNNNNRSRNRWVPK